MFYVFLLLFNIYFELKIHFNGPFIVHFHTMEHFFQDQEQEQEQEKEQENSGERSI